jgi:ribonuclease R
MNNRQGHVDDEAILRLLQQPDYAPMATGEIAAALKLKPRGRKILAGLLDAMVRDGRIVILRHNKFALGDPADLITGRLETRRSGGVISTLDGTPLMFVPKGQQSTALPGDLVTARRDPGKPASPGRLGEGKIIRIVERGQRLVVGTMRAAGKFFIVVPIDSSYEKDFYVADPKGANPGDRVVIQFTAWENSHVNPEAEVVDVIGPSDNPSLDTITIIRHFDLPTEFPPAVLHEAEEAGTLVSHPGKRVDLRNTYIFTIDPERARDFDDAISLETDAQGRRVLGVHIADVAHFIREGSALDKEAYKRGTSVYFPDGVLPMLPEQLSNGICSLRPDEDRLTFSAFLTFDAKGIVVERSFAKTLIRSKLRLTYEQALAVLEGKEPAGFPAEARDRILRVNDLSQELRRQRFGRYALDLEMPEVEFVMGPEHLITDIRISGSDPSHQLIEECMVAANEAVDMELSRRGLHLLHRVHEPPAEEKIADLSMELESMGYKPGNLNIPRNLTEFLASIRNDPLALHIQTSVLRSMKRAVYSPKADGHYGLAKKYYAHFTSPIRRYPDLVVHRILAGALAGVKPPYQNDRLPVLAEHCSLTERKAEEAERSLMEIKKYRYLEQQLERKSDLEYDAVVVTVTNFGMFIELKDLQLQGLVHVSSISRNFVTFDPARKALRSGADNFSVGMKVKVRVVKIDFDKRRIDFVLSGVESPKEGEKGNSGESGRRQSRGGQQRQSRGGQQRQSRGGQQRQSRNAQGQQQGGQSQQQGGQSQQQGGQSQQRQSRNSRGQQPQGGQNSKSQGGQRQPQGEQGKSRNARPNRQETPPAKGVGRRKGRHR